MLREIQRPRQCDSQFLHGASTGEKRRGPSENDWFIIFFCPTRPLLSRSELVFFFNGFCNTENGSKQTPSVSLFFFYLFIPPFSRPETSQQVTLVPLLPFFFHGIARPLLILREFFLSQEIAQSLEERSENRIFQLWPLFGFLMGPNISNRRSCVYICICVRV